MLIKGNQKVFPELQTELLLGIRRAETGSRHMKENDDLHVVEEENNDDRVTDKPHIVAN